MVPHEGIAPSWPFERLIYSQAHLFSGLVGDEQQRIVALFLGPVRPASLPLALAYGYGGEEPAATGTTRRNPVSTVEMARSVGVAPTKLSFGGSAPPWRTAYLKWLRRKDSHPYELVQSQSCYCYITPQ